MRDFAVVEQTTEVPVSQVHAWLMRKEILLVDVRETNEFEAEHINGAVLLPLSRFDADAFPALSGTRIVMHCAVGKRSEAARKMLAKAGHADVLNMTGGLTEWKAAGYETETE